MDENECRLHGSKEKESNESNFIDGVKKSAEDTEGIR